MRLLPRNIRTRLALGYALAVALTVVVYAAVVYAFTRSALIEQLDERLRADAERAHHAFEVAVDGTLDWKEVERPGHQHDPTGEGAWAQVLHEKSKQDIRRPAETDPSEAHWRILERPYAIAGETYRIRVGRSRRPLDQRMRDLVQLLALCFVPVVLLAWLGGRVLARRALEPVHVMTERARTIGADRLSERLHVGTDDELGRLAAAFNEAFGRIEGSFEQLERFTADAAHEMRTPLTTLRSVGEVGLQKPPEAQHEVIASMLEETDRLARLTEELLELSRGDTSDAAGAEEPVNLVALARAVCERLAVLASERRQELVVDGGEDVVVEAERSALDRAVTNLVDNAIRHGPPGSPIHVRVASVNGQTSLSVHDQGAVISPEHRDRIFDRFYQVDPSRAGSGTGLGLALAAQAVKRSGGRIDYQAGYGNFFRMEWTDA